MYLRFFVDKNELYRYVMYIQYKKQERGEENEYCTLSTDNKKNSV